MVTNKKAKGKAGSVAKGLLMGTGVALIVTVLFAVGMTQLIISEKINEKSMGYGAMVFLPVASALSALISVGVIKRRRIQVCMLAGVLYFIALGCINVVFFGGQFQGVGVMLMMVMLGAMGVGALGLRGEKGHRKKHKYSRPR